MFGRFTLLYTHTCNGFASGHVGMCMAGVYALDPDTALMLKAAEGDSCSFDLLLQRHRSQVVNHIFRLVHNRAIAEELAQDVFFRVYRSRAKYQPEAKFTTWLFRITTNVALNWRRDTRNELGILRLDDTARGVRKIEVLDAHPGADEKLVGEDRAKEIRDAIEALPSKQVAAILLHKYEGLDYAEIAEVLQCTIPALKSLMFRAYETLRRRLAHFAPSTPE
jgi:RNA polymerase sigma-70 factor (ECF subfamily)